MASQFPWPGKLDWSAVSLKTSEDAGSKQVAEAIAALEKGLPWGAVGDDRRLGVPAKADICCHFLSKTHLIEGFWVFFMDTPTLQISLVYPNQFGVISWWLLEHQLATGHLPFQNESVSNDLDVMSNWSIQTKPCGWINWILSLGEDFDFALRYANSRASWRGEHY